MITTITEKLEAAQKGCTTNLYTPEEVLHFIRECQHVICNLPLSAFTHMTVINCTMYNGRTSAGYSYAATIVQFNAKTSDIHIFRGKAGTAVKRLTISADSKEALKDIVKTLCKAGIHCTASGNINI